MQGISEFLSLALQKFSRRRGYHHGLNRLTPKVKNVQRGITEQENHMEAVTRLFLHFLHMIKNI